MTGLKPGALLRAVSMNRNEQRWEATDRGYRCDYATVQRTLYGDQWTVKVLGYPRSLSDGKGQPVRFDTPWEAMAAAERDCRPLRGEEGQP